MPRFYCTRPALSEGAGGNETELEAVVEAISVDLIRFATAVKVPNDTPLAEWRIKSDKNAPLVPVPTADPVPAGTPDTPKGNK